MNLLQALRVALRFSAHNKEAHCGGETFDLVENLTTVLLSYKHHVAK
jgi:hypothetical protein